LPRFFDRPEEGISSVGIVGKYSRTWQRFRLGNNLQLPLLTQQRHWFPAVSQCFGGFRALLHAVGKTTRNPLAEAHKTALVGVLDLSVQGIKAIVVLFGGMVVSSEVKNKKQKTYTANSKMRNQVAD
jgi:hypothetical protein